MAASEIPNGSMTPEAQWGEYNKYSFIIQQLINKVQTTTLVRVDAVTNNGGVSPIGFVDVTPLVNQVDGNGIPTPHVTIYNVPYMRVQGGADAIIIDPKPGDIGICSFASRDISKVKKTKAQANPGSARKFTWADGLYIGSVLNNAPTQYVQFSSAGIKIHSPTKVVLEAPVVEINASTSCTVNTATFTVNGATTINGPLSQTGAGNNASFSGNITTTTGDVIAQGTSLHTHVHSGVQTGPNQTGAPV